MYRSTDIPIILAEDLKIKLFTNEKFSLLQSEYQQVEDIASKVIQLLMPSINDYHASFFKEILDLLYLKLGVHQSKSIKNVIYIITNFCLIVLFVTCYIVCWTLSNSFSVSSMLPSFLP